MSGRDGAPDWAGDGDVRALARALAGRAIGRREFARRALALGLGVGALGELLAACGVPGDEDDAARPAAGRPMERELSIYNWSDYVAPETIPDFEREFGVAVTYDVYESNEEMLAKLLVGAGGYDLVFPSGYATSVLIALGLARPIERALVPNVGNVAPLFRGLAFDPRNRHSVPWQWGVTGIAWRTDRVAEAPTSWATFLDPRHAGRMTMMDDGRDVIGAWLRYRGHSLNATDPAALAGARADAIAAKRHLKAYLSAPVKGQVVAGDVWIAQMWNGEAAQVRAEQPAVGFAVPREGSTIWLDSLVIPARGPHPRAAHAFIDYALRPDVGAALSAWTGYGTPNLAAYRRMEAPVPYPTADELRRLEYQQDLGRATALWDEVWTEIRAA